MKKTFHIILILLPIFFNLGCTKKIAMSGNTEQLQGNGQKVQPYYLVKTFNKKKLYYLFGGMAIGFGIENQINNDKVNGQVALAGLLISTPFAFKRDKHEQGMRNSADYNEWLVEYNKKSKSNFEFAFKIKEDLYLAPKGESQKLANAYSDRIAAHKEYLKEVKQNNQRIAESWLGIATVIAISAADQAQRNSENRTTCSVCNGSGKSQHMDEYRNYNACPKCSGMGYLEKQ